MSSFMTWWWNKVSKCTIMEINENNSDTQLLHDSHTASTVTTHTVHTDLDSWTPHLPNTAHSCTQHVPFTPWFTSEWPDNIIPLPNHLLWCEYTVYPHVMLRHIIRPLGQSIYQGRLHMKLHSTPLFKSNWRVCNLNDKVLGVEIKWL